MEFSFFLFFVFGTQYHSNLPFLQSQAMSFFSLHKVNIKAFFFFFFSFFFVTLYCKQPCDFFSHHEGMYYHKTFFSFFFFLIFNSQNPQPPYSWVLFIYLFIIFHIWNYNFFYLFIYLTRTIHLNNTKFSISINKSNYVNKFSIFLKINLTNPNLDWDLLKNI